MPSDDRPKVPYGNYLELFQETTGEERVKALIKFSKENDVKDETRTFMSNFLPYVEFHSATMTPNPTVVFKFTVQPGHQNGLSNMHGGATASLFDWCTSVSLSLISKPGYWMFMGVTRNLSLSYLRPVPVGEVVLLECEVAHAGKRMCHLKGRMKRASDGVLLVTCEHDKVSTETSNA